MNPDSATSGQSYTKQEGIPKNKEPNFVEVGRSAPNENGIITITLRDINPNSLTHNQTMTREEQGTKPKQPGFYDPEKPDEGWDGDYSDNWSSMGATRYSTPGIDPKTGNPYISSPMTIEQLTQMGAQRGYINDVAVAQVMPIDGKMPPTWGKTPIYVYYNPGSSGGTSGIGNIPAMTMVYDNNGYLMTQGDGMPMNAFSPDSYTILGAIPAPGDDDGDPTNPIPKPTPILPIDPETGEPFDPIKFSMEQIKKPGLPEGTEFKFTDQRFTEEDQLNLPEGAALDANLSGNLTTGNTSTARDALEMNANTYTADQIYEEIKRLYGENNAVDKEVIAQFGDPSLKSLILNDAADEIVARNQGTYTVEASELPSRRGMVSDQPVQILGANGEVIGVVPAGAELPTAATIAAFGSEVLGIAERATSDFVSDEEGASRTQDEVTELERVAATQGGQILERALGKDTASLNATELAAAPAVEKTSNIIGEYFPAALDGDVNALDTVRGQLSLLMTDFNDGTPDWAAGSIRVANQVMAERGLGNSSMAAATIIQSAQEAALPIAQADAQVYANMNLTNLANKNKFALDNAAASRNFKLQDLARSQQTELANSVQRYQLLSASLSNYQAAVLANSQMSNALQEKDLSRGQQEQVVNAARYAELENINLTNEQQARITNEANNLTVDMAELSAKEKAILAELQVQGALEGKELDNIQQVNIIKASRYAENANLDFTAEQTRVFSNSKLLESLNLNNLDYDQARVLQNAANYSQMDNVEFNNRQAAQVENAKNFLSMNIANLTNDQQATILYSQQLQQGLLSDQAAQNAALQFNATSENQVEQFYENLTADIRKFNSTQLNAMEQFNSGQSNALEQFNTTLQNQREQFNAKNTIEIEQSNVNFRRELNTLNTAGINAQNQFNTQNLLNLSNQALSDIWQQYRDEATYAWNAGQNDEDRKFNLAMAIMQSEIQQKFFEDTMDYNVASGIGGLIGDIIGAVIDYNKPPPTE